MHVRHLFIVLLLALFVHAESRAVACCLPCADVDASEQHDDDHGKLGGAHGCDKCAGCASLLAGGTAAAPLFVFQAGTIVSALQPGATFPTVRTFFLPSRAPPVA